MPRPKHSNTVRPSTTKTSQASKIRIIGGEWRGRKLNVPDEVGLRPTGDRLRETLFNWLAPYIYGARCLDAFAGTGALGLEALSRGAKEVQFIESNPRTASALSNNLRILNNSTSQVYSGECKNWIENNRSNKFDIIFIDPPFAGELWNELFDSIVQFDMLQPEGLLYVECPKDKVLKLPEHWHVKKQKATGQVLVTLYETP